MVIQKIDFSESAEENIKTLSSSEIASHLSGLETRLSNLSTILTDQKDDFVVPYIDIIKNSIYGILLKHQMTGNARIDSSFSMIPKESGYPGMSDFFLLEKNQQEARGVLDSMHNKDKIIEMIRRSVFDGRPVDNLQLLLRRHKFYSAICDANLLKSLHLNELKDLGVDEATGREWYSLEWSCLERGVNVPVLYRMSFTQDKVSDGPGSKLQSFVYLTRSGIPDVRSFASLVDREVVDVHPKLVERYVIGPFYDRFTDNSPQINEILNGSEDSSILKFTVEKVASNPKRLKHYGTFWDRLFGRKTEIEVFDPALSETNMIVPFRLKQKLGNCDEYGNPCKVYGITNGGDIIG